MCTGNISFGIICIIRIYYDIIIYNTMYMYNMIVLTTVKYVYAENDRHACSEICYKLALTFKKVVLEYPKAICKPEVV